MNAAARFDIAVLLEMVGAKPPRYGRGKWGCPECGRPGHVSVNFAREAYKCWHAGCGFRGYRQSLEKRLGLSRELTPAERREQRRVFNESQRAAEWLAGGLRARRFELYDSHQGLLSMMFGAAARLRRDADHEMAWSALAYVYCRLDLLRAELAVLESAPIPGRLVMLSGSHSERKEIIRHISERGGLCVGDGQFIEIDFNCPGMLT